ncbi:MAG TPA: hypothetical protein VKS25_05695, partial [Solirubrobacteraceae bacterium]|nr:hypothetical protein [Solirubrobacteraceae bacterium]
ENQYAHARTLSRRARDGERLSAAVGAARMARAVCKKSNEGGAMRQWGRRARTALAITVAVAIVVPAAGAAAAAARTPAEKAFVKAYTALVPGLNKVSEAIISDTENAGKLTDAQVAAVYTRLAKQWSAATAAFVKLKPPAAYAATFDAASARVAPVEADLLATARAGRTHNGTAGRAAGRRLALDFNSLGAAVAKLKKLLGLP